jgi:signal transduction histidine kinase
MQWTPYLVPLFVGTVTSWALAVFTFRKRARRAALPLLAVLVGTGSWSLTYALQLSNTGFGAKLLWSRVTYLWLTFVPLATLLFAVAYTNRTSELSPRWVGGLAIPAVVLNGVVWVRPAWLMADLRVATVEGLELLVWQPTTLWLALTGYAYLLVVVAVVLVGREAVRSFHVGRFRGQAVSILVAMCVPLLTDVYAQTQGVSVSLTPMALSVTGVLLAVALFRYDLVDIMPVARRTVLTEMDDAVVTLDPNDTVVDLNKAARELFDVDGPGVGMDAEALFADYLEMVEQYRDVYDVKTEVSVEVGDDVRTFDLKISPVDYGDPDRRGRIVVLRDITDLKAHESELTLLKQVFARVLRHNIRNDLNVIISRAEFLADRHDGEDAAMAEDILDRGESLVETSQKVREAEQIVAVEKRLLVFELSRTLDRLVEAFATQYPDARFETDLAETARVRAHSALPVALENLVENAIVHNDQPDPRVSISVRSGSDEVTLTVTDDGPGIPTSEVEVLESERETALQHGSGVGLWLVDLIVERSGGTLSFEETDDGTSVRLNLPVPTDG